MPIISDANAGTCTGDFRYMGRLSAALVSRSRAECEESAERVVAGYSFATTSLAGYVQ